MSESYVNQRGKVKITISALKHLPTFAPHLSWPQRGHHFPSARNAIHSLKRGFREWNPQSDDKLCSYKHENNHTCKIFTMFCNLCLCIVAASVLQAYSSCQFRFPDLNTFPTEYRLSMKHTHATVIARGLQLHKIIPGRWANGKTDSRKDRN